MLGRQADLGQAPRGESHGRGKSGHPGSDSVRGVKERYRDLSPQETIAAARQGNCAMYLIPTEADMNCPLQFVIYTRVTRRPQCGAERFGRQWSILHSIA